MRAFIGIKLNDCLFDIINILEEYRSKGVEGNYSRIENIHLTIEFLGNITEDDIIKISKIFDKLDFKQFLIKTKKITTLKDILILQIEKNNDLIFLQRKIHQMLLSEGFNLELRDYYPHVTLIRRFNQKVNCELELVSYVDEIILFKSETINKVLTYTPILKRRLEVK